MNKNNSSRYRVWFEKASDDIKYAEGNLSLKFYTQVCFLTQQAAEKALKSYLIFKGVSSWKIRLHTLPGLLKRCLMLEPSFRTLKEHCKILDRYYIPTHYPPDAGPLGEFTQEEVVEALNLAKEVVSFVETKLKA